jgi:putative peptidoglycan lipid II flippase
VKIAIITLIATQLMNLAFILPLRHAGLALSIGLASCLNATLLYRGLRKRNVYLPQAGWGKFALKLLAALAVMGGVLWFASGPAALWTEIGGLERAGRLALVVGAGALAYFATLFALGFRVRDFRRRGTT